MRGFIRFCFIYINYKRRDAFVCVRDKMKNYVKLEGDVISH